MGAEAGARRARGARGATGVTGATGGPSGRTLRAFARRTPKPATGARVNKREPSGGGNGGGGEGDEPWGVGDPVLERADMAGAFEVEVGVVEVEERLWRSKRALYALWHQARVLSNPDKVSQTERERFMR
jgi:hypothetical protein